MSELNVKQAVCVPVLSEVEWVHVHGLCSSYSGLLSDGAFAYVRNSPLARARYGRVSTTPRREC